MKLLYILLSLIFFQTKIMAQKANPKYDSVLAKHLGADDYGMKHYVFVLLKSGNNQSTDKKFKDSCFAGHMENIKRLAAIKKLVVAGPFAQNDKMLRGLFILNVSTIEEANALLNTDPAVKAGFLQAELFKWYGSAALSEYLEAAEKTGKYNF